MRIPCLTVPAMTVALPETSAMFARISSEASERISDFAIERQIVLGCFMDPSSQMISESRQFIDQLENGPTGNVLLDALAGDESARTALKDANIPQYSPFDVDRMLSTKSAMWTIRCDMPRHLPPMAIASWSTAPSRSTAEQAVAIASRCLMNGRSVLYVPGVPSRSVCSSRRLPPMR